MKKMFFKAFNLCLLLSLCMSCQSELTTSSANLDKLYQSPAFLSYADFMEKRHQLDQLVRINPYEMEGLAVDEKLAIAKSKKEVLSESAILQKALFQFLENNELTFDREPSEQERQEVLQAARTFISGEPGSELAKKYVLGRFEMDFSPEFHRLTEEIWQQFPSLDRDHYKLMELYTQYKNAGHY